MARRIADVRAGLLTAAGPHRRDPLALPATLDEPAPGASLRVAVVAEPPGGETDAGHVVEEVTPVSYARVLELWAGLLGADIQPLRAQLDELMGEDGRRFLDFGTEGTPAIDVAGTVGMHLARNAVDLESHSFLSDWDVLLSPTWAQPALPHGADLVSADAAMDVLVALRSVSCGTAGGLPIGAQFTARRFSDLTALAAAQAIEDAVGPLTPIDPVPE